MYANLTTYSTIIMKLDSDAANFLETLLFCTEELKGRTIFSFSPEFVSAVEKFCQGFREFLDAKGFDMSRLDYLEHTFGGNCYLSLSGNGAGFFDEYGDPEKTLGDELQSLIVEYSGKRYRFEMMDLSENEAGQLDLSFLPEFLTERREAMFTV